MRFDSKKESVKAVGRLQAVGASTFQVHSRNGRDETIKHFYGYACFMSLVHYEYGNNPKVVYTPHRDGFQNKGQVRWFYNKLLNHPKYRLKEFIEENSIDDVMKHGITTYPNVITWTAFKAINTLFRYPIEAPNIVDLTKYYCEEGGMEFDVAFILAHVTKHPQISKVNTNHTFYACKIQGNSIEYIRTDVNQLIKEINEGDPMAESCNGGFQSVLFGNSNRTCYFGTEFLVNNPSNEEEVEAALKTIVPLLREGAK